MARYRYTWQYWSRQKGRQKIHKNLFQNVASPMKRLLKRLLRLYTCFNKIKMLLSLPRMALWIMTGCCFSPFSSMKFRLNLKKRNRVRSSHWDGDIRPVGYQANLKAGYRVIRLNIWCGRESDILLFYQFYFWQNNTFLHFTSSSYSVHNN